MIGIGERLKEGIKRSNYTQKELSAILQISEDSITRYIKETQYPKIDLLIKLCNEINISIYWLVTGEENHNIKLTENEKELLENFKHLPDREQIKFIARVEDIAIQYKSNEKKSSTTKIG